MDTTTDPAPADPMGPSSTHKRHIGRIALGAIVVGLVAASVLAQSGSGGRSAGTGGAPSAAPTTTTAQRVARPTRTVDELVAVGGGRLHLHCIGAGDTTVLLLAGWGDPGDQSWSTVMPVLAEHDRVCTYDRYGTGTSDAPPRPQTFGIQADELSVMLDTAGEPGPYLVVGHSFGGAEAVMFADRHRDEVTGLVLVDASPTTWPATVCAVPEDGSDAARAYADLCGIFRDPLRDPERLDAFPAFDEVATIESFGDLPMVVLTAAHRSAPGLAAHELDRLDDVWLAGQRSWAAITSHSVVEVVEESGHYIQLEHPDRVLDAIGDVSSMGGTMG